MNHYPYPYVAGKIRGWNPYPQLPYFYTVGQLSTPLGKYQTALRENDDPTLPDQIPDSQEPQKLAPPPARQPLPTTDERLYALEEVLRNHHDVLEKLIDQVDDTKDIVNTMLDRTSPTKNTTFGRRLFIDVLITGIGTIIGGMAMMLVRDWWEASKKNKK